MRGAYWGCVGVRGVMRGEEVRGEYWGYVGVRGVMSEDVRGA